MISRFIIISTQRTGSTLLRTSLDSHPDIRCHGEVFLPHYGGGQGYYKYVQQQPFGRLGNIIRRKTTVFEYLDRLYAEPGHGAIGLKVMYGQLRVFPRYFPMILDYIREFDIGVIHHVRENPVLTLVSRYRLKESGVAHARTDRESQAAQKQVFVPVNRLIRNLDMLEKQKKRWREELGSVNHIEVTYENLTGGTEGESKRILRFLNVDDTITLESSLRRIATRPLSQMVENFGDFRRVLQGTEYEQYLVDRRLNNED